jgi:hypothetical protein
MMRHVTTYQLSAIGYRLLAIGYWLLAIGYWLLAIGRVASSTIDTKEKYCHAAWAA